LHFLLRNSWLFYQQVPGW